MAQAYRQPAPGPTENQSRASADGSVAGELAAHGRRVVDAMLAALRESGVPPERLLLRRWRTGGRPGEPRSPYTAKTRRRGWLFLQPDLLPLGAPARPTDSKSTWILDTTGAVCPGYVGRALPRYWNSIGGSNALVLAGPDVPHDQVGAVFTWDVAAQVTALLTTQGPIWTLSGR